MTIQNLLDNWAIYGDNLNDFKKELKDLDESTKVINESTQNIKMLSLNENSTTENVLSFTPFTAGITIDDLPAKGNILKKKSILKHSKDASILIDELENKNKTMMQIGMYVMFVGEDAFSSLAARSKTSGDILKYPKERDFIFAHQFGKDQDVNIVSRFVNGINKIFAVLSDKYAYIPQSILVDIIENLISNSDIGEASDIKWAITHEATHIYMEFPDNAQEISDVYDLPDIFIPGIYLSKSDIGECSLTAKGTWRFKKSVSVNKTVKRKHIGTIDLAKFSKNVETNIFSEYTKLPERMCELMMQNLTDATLDLKTVEGREQNSKDIEKCINSIFEQIGMDKTIGRRPTKELLSAITDEIDPSISFTAYDVAIMLLEMPDRVVEMSDRRQEMLSVLVGRVPYAKYEIPKRVILTA